MDADRVNKIIQDRARLTLWAINASPAEIEKMMADDSDENPAPLPLMVLDILRESPRSVREDAQRMMELIVAAMDKFQRDENRVIDGRASLIALSLLESQQCDIQRRVIDEDVGPNGPYRN